MTDAVRRAAAVRPGSRRLAALVLLLLLTASFGVRVHHILDNSPYPRHVDEETFLENSLRMLNRRSLEPMTLNWPTLPIYMAAAAQVVGLQWERAKGTIAPDAVLRPAAFPFYPLPGVVLPSKILFAAISVATLLLAGIIAWKMTGSALAIALAPCVLALNALYLDHSWSYLNVDIVGCFFIVAALAYLVGFADDRDDMVHKAIVPGIFVGLASASKYTNAAIALPFLISIALANPRKLPSRSLVLGLTSIVTFAIAMPYALLDFDGLVHWILRQREIYSEGWPGYTVQAGLPHFAIQMRHLVESYGYAIWLAGLFGIGHSLVCGGRKGLELAAYPVFFTLYFCTYSVDLLRNLLTVHALFAVFAAIGLVAIARWISDRLQRSGRFASRPDRLQSISAAVVLGVAMLAAPWNEIRAAYAIPRDSRHLASAWIRENVESGATLVIARELNFDARPLRDDYRVMIRPFARGATHANRIFGRPPPLLREQAELGALFVVPEFGWMEPWSDRRPTARRLNRRFGGGEVLAEFGSRPIPVEYFEAVPDGDPKLSIRRGDIVADE